MAVKTHALVSLWCVPSSRNALRPHNRQGPEIGRCADRCFPALCRFALTVPVIFWDAGYCFFR